MPTLLEYARMADKAYTPSTDANPSIPGYTCYVAPKLALDDTSVLHGGRLLSSGLQARVFLRDKPQKEAVIAFKGTVPTMVSDLVADLRIVLEGVPTQAHVAIKLVREWKGALTGYRVTSVGHSLGGGIAQIVGMSQGVKFVTFNAPGMWTNAVGIAGFRAMVDTTKRGINYIKWGDAVGNFGKHVGDTVRVRSTGHSIVGFVDFLKTYADRDKDPLAGF